MSSKQLPKAMSEDYIKYWMANTNLTRDELIQWYASFVEAAAKTDKMDKATFSKFISKLNVKNKNADTLNELIFSGKC